MVVSAAVGSLGLGVLTAGAVANAESGSGMNRPHLGGSSFVDKIVSKFNLDKAEVQDFMDEYRTEIDDQRQQRVDDRLQKLVSKGSITAEQKGEIEKKLQELQAERRGNRDEVRNMTPEEHRTFMDKKRSDLEEWAKSHDIDLHVLRGIFGGHGKGHGGHGERM